MKSFVGEKLERRGRMSWKDVSGLECKWCKNREREREREGVQGGSELKRLVLPNEVNTPSGRVRLPCRAETVVTSVILQKTANSSRGGVRVNCRQQDRDEGGRDLKGERGQEETSDHRASSNYAWFPSSTGTRGFPFVRLLRFDSFYSRLCLFCISYPVSSSFPFDVFPLPIFRGYVHG